MVAHRIGLDEATFSVRPESLRDIRSDKLEGDQLNDGQHWMGKTSVPHVLAASG